MYQILTPILSWRVLPAVLILSMIAGCAQFQPLPEPEPTPVAEQEPPEPTPEPPKKKPALYEWYGDGRRVARIEVDTDAQRAIFYDESDQIGWTTIATGVRSYPTPTGSFSVIEKVADKRSNLYGKIYKGRKLVKSNAKIGRDSVPAGGRFVGAKMPYFMRLTNDGIGLHAGSIPRPGRPASHGCIRMPHAFAPILYKHVDVGTPVTIRGSGPSYASYIARQRRQPVARPAAAPAAAPVVAAAVASEAGTVASVPEVTPGTPSGTDTSATSVEVAASPVGELPESAATQAAPATGETAVARDETADTPTESAPVDTGDAIAAAPVEAAEPADAQDEAAAVVPEVTPAPLTSDDSGPAAAPTIAAPEPAVPEPAIPTVAIPEVAVPDVLPEVSSSGGGSAAAPAASEPTAPSEPATPAASPTATTEPGSGSGETTP